MLLDDLRSDVRLESVLHFPLRPSAFLPPYPPTSASSRNDYCAQRNVSASDRTVRGTIRALL